MRRLTEAQQACLTKLAEERPFPFDGWCNYGTACGVKRNVVRALEKRGYAEMRPDVIVGVSARITPAGRAKLAEDR